MRKFDERIFRRYKLSEIKKMGGDKFPRFCNYTENTYLKFPEGEVNTHFIGYVEMHTDGAVGHEKKWFFRVIYQAPNAAFVYTDKDGKFAMIRRFDPKQTYEVNFRKEHALMPIHIAYELVKRQSKDFSEYQWWESKAKTQYTPNPKLVFVFLNGHN